MIVAGIDPSLTSAGVAILSEGEPVHVSHHGHPGHKLDSYRTRSRRVRKQVADVVTAVMSHGATPDLVVIEEHPYAVRISAGEFDRCALWHGIFGAFDARGGTPVVVMNNMTAKKWITGRGDAKKPDIVATVESWWPGSAVNDDEADALGLAAIGAFHLGDPMPFEPKPRHTTGLEKVAWPA